jgi:cobalt-zinc-cadmium efflux system outer membrane protein
MWAAEPMLSLRDAIDATLQANAQLEIYHFREQALEGQRFTASLRPPLQLNTGVEDAFGSGALHTLDSAEFTLSLSRVIELGGQRDARVGVLSQRADVLRAERRIAELDLLAEVTRRYIAVAAAQEQFSLQQRATVLAQQTLDALQPLVTAGQAPASEQARATASLARARLAEDHARVTLDAAKVELASMWSGTPEFSSVTADLLQVGAAGVLSDLLLALDENPDLQRFASEERLLEAQIMEAKSEERGAVQVTAGIRHLRNGNDTGFLFSASMPLGSQERARGAVLAARAGQQEVVAERALTLNRMRARLTGLHLQLAHAVLEVNTLRGAVLPQLDSALQQTRDAYLGGRYSYAELVAAQREYLDAEGAMIEAATDAHLLRVEIERLSGAALPSTEEPIP